MVHTRLCYPTVIPVLCQMLISLGSDSKSGDFMDPEYEEVKEALKEIIKSGELAEILRESPRKES